MRITKKQARLFLLYYQDLLMPRRLCNKDGMMKFMYKVGSIQYDPLSIIDTNPNLVFQSRVKNYQSNLLYELLYEDRLLIDDWDKNQSIYPIKDWPYFRRYRQKGLRTHSKVDLSQHEIINDIKSIIKKRGPISSIDINDDKKVDWFWNHTKLSKVALESMYIWGDLVISHKEGVRKYYDLATRVIPKDIYEMSDPNKYLEDFFKWIVKRRIGSVGLLWNRGSNAYLGIYFMKSKERNQAFKSLYDNNKLIEVEVENIKYPLYIRKDDEWMLYEVIDGLNYIKTVSFIAPLDNIMWDRKLIKALFDFDYTWEVYKPKKQRLYGYYVLPVLYGDSFIGRIEPVFDKKSKTLKIKNFWFEDDVKINKTLIQKIENAIEKFAKYLNASNIQYICKLDKK